MPQGRSVNEKLCTALGSVVSVIKFCLLQALREADNRVSLIWKHQLMQFNNLSESMAAAVVASWPSPAHLLSVRIFSFFSPSISVFVAIL